MSSATPRTVRLRSGIETINGITGETAPTYSEYVLLADYQRDLAAALEENAKLRKHAEAMASFVIGGYMDKEQYRAIVDLCYAYRADFPKEPR